MGWYEALLIHSKQFRAGEMPSSSPVFLELYSHAALLRFRRDNGSIFVVITYHLHSDVTVPEHSHRIVCPFFEVFRIGKKWVTIWRTIKEKSTNYSCHKSRANNGNVHLHSFLILGTGFINDLLSRNVYEAHKSSSGKGKREEIIHLSQKPSSKISPPISVVNDFRNFR